MIDFAAHTATAIKHLGQPVTVTPSGGPARVVNAVLAMTPADIFSAENYRRQARLAYADAIDLRVNDTLVSGSLTYTVAAREINEQSGDVVLFLK
jgi:hypothetical protein